MGGKKLTLLKAEDLQRWSDSATPGPWYPNHLVCPSGPTKWVGTIADVSEEGWLANHHVDATFVSFARNYFPVLLKALELAADNSERILDGREYVGGCICPDYWIEQAAHQLGLMDVL